MAPLNNHIWVCHSKYSPFCTVCTELFDVEDIVTLKSGLEVTQGHRKWYHSKAGPRRNIAIPFWTEKLEWCGYLMAKKSSSICIPFLTEYWHVTDRRMDGLLAMAQSALCTAFHGKNPTPKISKVPQWQQLETSEPGWSNKKTNKAM